MEKDQWVGGYRGVNSIRFLRLVVLQNRVFEVLQAYILIYICEPYIYLKFFLESSNKLSVTIIFMVVFLYIYIYIFFIFFFDFLGALVKNQKRP